MGMLSSFAPAHSVIGMANAAAAAAAGGTRVAVLIIVEMSSSLVPALCSLFALLWAGGMCTIIRLPSGRLRCWYRLLSWILERIYVTMRVYTCMHTANSWMYVRTFMCECASKLAEKPDCRLQGWWSHHQHRACTHPTSHAYIMPFTACSYGHKLIHENAGTQFLNTLHYIQVIESIATCTQ